MEGSCAAPGLRDWRLETEMAFGWTLDKCS